mmetsp:Transcript_29484/g.83162  ORF Transcript_29484/g.83162 Transcript_29484/m.83162 type:complete len:226 (+) Transcript_29484:501-1178(+)|eukprot:CAMPEP_0117657476 /NCGR_PEP_ID=MMETSP0804-20121206/5352_1 /TAXON_ID=1074897 /ORGANISM="Tetraselmis astigmatica, Strain CCMP880" /LENGTH=225 /DNA_ID=CAMNT_0005463935 /DNA_START=450 /DNA_END=1127 /DNA_ORIENTATION=-
MVGEGPRPVSFRGSSRRGKLWLDQKFNDANVVQARLLEPSPRERLEATAALTGLLNHTEAVTAPTTPCTPSTPSTVGSHRLWDTYPASSGAPSPSHRCSYSAASSPSFATSPSSHRRVSLCSRLSSVDYDFLYELPELQESGCSRDQLQIFSATPMTKPLLRTTSDTSNTGHHHSRAVAAVDETPDSGSPVRLGELQIVGKSGGNHCLSRRLSFQQPSHMPQHLP